MSAERTLMSWLRTAVSMVGFGFTIVQFFEHFHRNRGREVRRDSRSSALARPLLSAAVPSPW